jgi:hypothetical protein
MLGQVTARHVSAYVAQQLKVLLPEELILMHQHDPITQFGSYKVPLNLKDAEGNQVIDACSHSSEQLGSAQLSAAQRSSAWLRV